MSRSQSGSTGDHVKAGLPKPVLNGLTVCAPHLTRFQHYLCIMLHPLTLLACHRNPSPSPVSQRLNPRVDNGQERHGSSSSTDKLLDMPERGHVKPLKTGGGDLIANALQQTQREGYHCQATKYLPGWMNKGFEFGHGSTGVKWNPGGIIMQKVSDGSTVSPKNGTCAVNLIRRWNNQRTPWTLTMVPLNCLFGKVRSRRRGLPPLLPALFCRRQLNKFGLKILFGSLAQAGLHCHRHLVVSRNPWTFLCTIASVSTGGRQGLRIDG